MPVRLGIVGAGAIAPTHAQAIQGMSNAELIGFFDVVPERSLVAAERFGASAFPTLKSLAAEVDAVCICVPSGLHAALGIQAAEFGLSVLVEKPIDVTLAAARELVDRCRNSQVKLSVISQHRFAPDIQRLKDSLTGGELGRPLEGDAYIKWYRTQHYYDSGDWRATWSLDGGGCLMNQGVHYIDMIQWIMGGVESVQAQVRTAAHDIEVEDIAAALVRYNSGATGVIQGSTSFFPGFSERLEVHGRHGSVLIEGDVARVWEIDQDYATDDSPYGRGVRMQPAPNLRLVASPDELGEPDKASLWVEQHRRQIRDFVAAIEEDREPYITGEMALEPLRVILAIYKSSKEDGRRVYIDEVS